MIVGLYNIFTTIWFLLMLISGGFDFICLRVKERQRKPRPMCNALDMPTSVTVLYYEKFTVRFTMRKTQMNSGQPECASPTTWTNWSSINWTKVMRDVKSLQAIVKAVKAKHFHKAKVLLHLLTRSFYGKLLAILRDLLGMCRWQQLKTHFVYD